VFTHIQKREVGRKEKGDKKDREKRGRRNTKEFGTQKVLKVEESLWEERVRKNASVKGLGPCN